MQHQHMYTDTILKLKIIKCFIYNVYIFLFSIFFQNYINICFKFLLCTCEKQITLINQLKTL